LLGLVLLVPLALLVVPGCAPSPSVSIHFDQATDFSAFETFTMGIGWYMPEADAFVDDAPMPWKLRRAIEEETIRTLAARGLTVGPRKYSDLHIECRLWVEEEHRGMFTKNSQARMLGTMEMPYVRLSIFMFESGRDAAIWDGSIDATLDTSDSGLSKLQRAVYDLLSRYPPRPER
jgi:hypothetical protein